VIAAVDIQSSRDRTLREELSADRGVQLAMRKLEERVSGYGFQTRRRLLTGALRLNRTIAPQVDRALAACREVLGFEQPVELYVKPDPMLQAFCAKSLGGPLIVGLSSRMLETFSDVELRFVIGHELGHAIFDHFAIPMPSTATIEDVGGKLVTRPVQLRLFLWCRAAEISADRAGLVCAQDEEAAAHALLKIASGLGTGVIRPDLEAFTSQVEALLVTPAACADERFEESMLDCFDTHPYSPIRVRALLAFGRSQVYRRAAGRGDDGITAEELERLVEQDLSLMEPSYLEDRSETSELMRKVLYGAGVAVAAANGEITESEMKALRTLLGAKHAETPEDVETVKRELEQRCEEARSKVPLIGRTQIMQHATIIAAADGVVDASELEELTRLAAALEVDPQVIDQTLAGAAAPMD
jgi:Zn-dependent protease with chaperone function/tellurite resistance protein